MGKIFTFLLASLDKEALPKRVSSWRKDFAQMGAKSVLKEIDPHWEWSYNGKQQICLPSNCITSSQVFSQTDKPTFVCLAFTCEYLGTKQQETSRANKFMVKGCTANVFQPLFIGKTFVPSCFRFWIMNSFQNGVYSWRFVSLGSKFF